MLDPFCCLSIEFSGRNRAMTLMLLEEFPVTVELLSRLVDVKLLMVR